MTLLLAKSVAPTVANQQIMFKKAGLEITHTFGNYELDTFNKQSKRLIFIGKLSAINTNKNYD